MPSIQLTFEMMNYEELQKKEIGEFSSSVEGTTITTSTNNIPVRELHPLEAVFKRHRSDLKWPCSRCNQDFEQYRDLFAHMEAGVHVNVEPSKELKPLYEKMKKMGSSKSIWSRAAKGQQKKQRKDKMIACSTEDADNANDENDKDNSNVAPPSPPPGAHLPLPPPILNVRNQVRTFVVISVDCHFCAEMFDTGEALGVHLLTVHGHKKALCSVESCRASFDEWLVVTDNLIYLI